MARIFGVACALGAAAILGGCGSLPSFPDRGSKASAQTAPRRDDVRVMSFNIRTRTVIDLGNHWNLRRNLLVSTVRKFDPDLLGTQECQPAQADFLRKKLPEYAFVGAGRDDGRRDGEMCGIFYKTTRFTRLDEGHFWLSESPERPGSRGWGGWFPRMVTWVKLRPRSGGEDFYFFNTHLDAFSGHARLQASRLLRERMERIAGDAPVVLTGDFNTDEGTAPYRVLTGSRLTHGSVALVDTLRAVQPRPRHAEGTRHGFRGGTDGDRIDWILATPDFQPVEAGIDRTRRGGRYPSDHFPVTAVLRWRSPVAAAGRPSTGG